MSIRPRGYYGILFLLIALLSGEEKTYANDLRVGCWEDAMLTQSLQDILNQDNGNLFDYSTNLAYGKGLVDTRFWLKLDSQLEKTGDFILTIENHLVDSVELFVLDQGTYISKGQAGARIAHDQWAMDATYPSFQLSPQDLGNPIYLKVHVSTLSNLPIKLTRLDAFMRSELKLYTFFGIFNGTLLLFLIYASIAFRKNRERIFLYFIFYILITMMITAIFKGYAYRFIWPSFPGFNYYAAEIFMTLLSFICTLFAKSVLRLERYSPKLEKIFIVLMIIPFILLALVPFVSKPTAVMFFNTFPHGALFFVVIVSIWIWRKGHEAAKWFTIGWLALSFGGICFFGKDMGLMPHNDFTDNIIYLGVLIEVIMFSLAVGLAVKSSFQENKYQSELSDEIQQQDSVPEASEKHQEDLQVEKPMEKQIFRLREVNQSLNMPLSKRELEVLELLLEGEQNRTISDKLGVSENTIKKHIASIYRKLEVRNRMQLSTKTLAITQNYPNG